VTVLPFRPRPRGRRKIAPARLRAASDPYAAEHRRRRKLAMAALAAAGGWPCPGGCGRMMYAWQGRALHLHHSGGLESKLRGEPGDVLMCAKCNRSDGGKVGANVTNSKTVTASGTVPVRQSRQW
jgi:hypothetical protein